MTEGLNFDTRAEACLSRVRDLNPNVKVDFAPGSIEDKVWTLCFCWEIKVWLLGSWIFQQIHFGNHLWDFWPEGVRACYGLIERFENKAYYWRYYGNVWFWFQWLSWARIYRVRHKNYSSFRYIFITKINNLIQGSWGKGREEKC